MLPNHVLLVTAGSRRSSCMIAGSSIGYHSMKQCRILHENLDKCFAEAIVGEGQCHNDYNQLDTKRLLVLINVMDF